MKKRFWRTVSLVHVTSHSRRLSHHAQTDVSWSAKNDCARLCPKLRSKTDGLMNLSTTGTLQEEEFYIALLSHSLLNHVFSHRASLTSNAASTARIRIL